LLKSEKLTAYYGRNLTQRLSAFGSVTVDAGNVSIEFGALFNNRITLGLKTFPF